MSFYQWVITFRIASRFWNLTAVSGYGGHVRKLGKTNDLELNFTPLKGIIVLDKHRNFSSLDLFLTDVMLAVYDGFIAHLPSCNCGS